MDTLTEACVQSDYCIGIDREWTLDGAERVKDTTSFSPCHMNHSLKRSNVLRSCKRAEKASHVLHSQANPGGAQAAAGAQQPDRQCCELLQCRRVRSFFSTTEQSTGRGGRAKSLNESESRVPCNERTRHRHLHTTLQLLMCSVQLCHSPIACTVQDKKITSVQPAWLMR